MTEGHQPLEGGGDQQSQAGDVPPEASSESDSRPAPVIPSRSDIAAQEEVVELLEDVHLSPEQALRVGAVIATQYSGPLPPAEQLAGYDQVLPGAADRVIGMAEKEQEHRHLMDGKVVMGELRAAREVRWIGFALAMVVLLGGIILVAIGKQVEGHATLVTAVVGLLALFFASGRRNAGTDVPTEVAARSTTDRT